MEWSFVFFMFGLTVNAQNEDFQDYQSLQTESTTYPAALPSTDQNNPGYNTRKASTESLPRLTVALIASPGTDLFHAPHERHRSTTVHAMTATAEEVISSRDERFVSNHGSGLFTSGEDNTSAMPLSSGADLPLISDEKEGESVVTSAQAGSGLVMNGTTTAAAHLSRGREKIAASLHAPLNSKNQRAVESITLLPAKSIPMLSASDPAVIDNLGEATETVERQRKSINENGSLKSLGTTNPLNATESIFTDGEKTFVQKGSPTIIRLTAVQNRTQLDAERSAAGVKTVAQKNGDGQSGQKNMPTLSLVTRHNAVFDVDTPLLLESSNQEVVKETAESTKSLTTKGHTGTMRVYTDAVDEKLHVSKFSQPSEVPFPKTGKLHVTKSSVTSPLTHTLLRRIVSASDESEGELASASAVDSQVGSTIHSLSQTVQSSQSSTLVKDEERLKFLTVLPVKFTDRPSVLIKVKNATQPENHVLIAPQNISTIDSHFFQMSEHCCKVSIENRTLYPQVNENSDKLIDNRTELSNASSAIPVAGTIMTVSAQSKGDSDSTMPSRGILTKLTPNPLITPSNSMHHSVTSDHPDELQKIPSTPLQTPQREIQNLSLIFEGHAVTYSPVKQLLFPSLTGSAKPLTFLSSPAGHTLLQSSRVLKEHPLILPFGDSASTPKSVTFQEFKKAQASTSFHPTNKSREPTVFPKLPTLHSERLIRTTNTWPVTGKGSANSSFTRFTRTGPDKGSTLLPIVPSLSPAAQTHNTNVPPTTLAENLATASYLDEKSELFFITLSHKKASREMMPASTLQDSVSHPSRVSVASRLEITERDVISRDMFTNQTLMTEQTNEKQVGNSVHVPTSMKNESDRKSKEEMDINGMLFTHSPLKQQSEQNQSAVMKVESSTGAEVLDQNSQNTVSMQNEKRSPATVPLQNIVSSSQSRGQDLQKTTEGQMNASVSPAAIESFLSTQPLASPATAKTPKTVEQTINQASSLSSTLSSIIAAVSNGKDINGPLLPYQTASAGDHLQQAASSQAPRTRQAMKRHTINISAVKHLTLNPATSPPPKPTTRSVKSTLQAGGPNKLFTIHSLPLTPSKSLTDYLTMLRSHPHVKENVLKERSMQTTLPSITEGTFFAISHTDVSMAGSEITATTSPQASSLQLSEESESDLSTVFPFESNLAKSTELMSDLPVMQRRMRIASPDFLSGLAQISDDICGSGNYTAEMHLTLERDIMPGDLVPALGNLHVVINLKTNNTQVNLEIKSCCLSPTVRLDEFNTTCCLFSRLPIDPQGIRLLPTVLSKRASFTISLFQMINYSTAYLHCDLSVCLRNNTECERCQQLRNAHATDDGQVLFRNTGNRISFGPVLKEADDSAFIETAGLDSAEAAVILGSVSGCFLICIALMLLWTIYRHHLQRSGHCQCWTPHGCSRNGEHFLP